MTLGAEIGEIVSILNRLETQVQNVLDGRITPTMLPPEFLLGMLKNISKRLPREMYFPFNYETELIELYKGLNVIPISHVRGIYLIIAVNILDSRHRFTMFNVISVPMFFPGTRVTAEYEIKHQHFAVSDDLAWVMFLSEEEYQKCARPYFHFCSINTALYAVSEYTDDCLMNLFMKNQFHEEVCPIVFKHNSKDVEIKYVTSGTWIVSTSKTVVIRIVCQERPSTSVMISHNIHNLKLEPNCEAFSPLFKLGMYSTGTIHYEIHLPPRMLHSNASIWSPIIHLLSKAEREHTEKLPEALPSLINGAGNFEKLAEKVQTHLTEAKELIDNPPARDSGSTIAWYVYVIIILVIVILIIGAAFFCYFYCFKKRLYSTLSSQVIKNATEKLKTEGPEEGTSTNVAMVSMRSNSESGQENRGFTNLE